MIDMFAFARWIQEEAEPDAPAREAIFVAHHEYCFGEGRTESEYFSTPAVVSELTEAATKFLAVMPTRAETRHVPALNYMLLTVMPIDARSAQATRDIIERLDNRIAASPWDYFRFPSVPRRFAKAQAQRAKAAKKY